MLNDIIRSVLEMIEAFETADIQQKHYTPEQCDAIYMYVNELIVIALDCRKIGVEVPEELLLSTITRQLYALNVSTIPDQKILILLFVVYKVIAELKSNIPLTFIQTIFTNETNIQHLKFSCNNQIVKAFVKIYQTILNSKVVELLQETYSHIIKDLTLAIEALESHSSSSQCNGNEIYTKTQAECIVAFYLSTISTLATATSSIIVMWVLEPNLLELLTERLQPANYQKFWSMSPETHFAIITLLISHCRNNNNFIASSTLLNEELTKITDVFSKLKVDDNLTSFSNEFIPGASCFNVPVASDNNQSAESSPTAGHFEQILKFLCKIFNQTLNKQSQILLIDWCENIIKHTPAYAHILENTPEFVQIFESINRLASESNATKSIQLKAAECFHVLLTYDTIHSDLYESIAETCCIKMCASDTSIRKRYSDLFAMLPLNVSLKQVNQFTGLAKSKQRQINSLEHWYLRTPIHQRGIEMRSQFFADFMRAIKTTTNHSANTDRCNNIERILKTMFIHSQCNISETKSKSNEVNNFCKAILSDARVLISWAQWEAAQSCVNNKLRTVLGKPQETFLKIESIIKENARILSQKEKSKVSSVDTVLANQRHARILLGFMESLEKYIYNASEGTAIALPSTEKPARTFFHVNATTCNEWFNRIRTAVDLVALHCMEPEMVIRYTESVLKHLAANGKINDPLFEQTLISHAFALLRNKEGDALLGLFEWTKSVTKKKFSWIKLAAGKVSNQILIFTF